MTLFEKVKESVTTRQAAERYGLRVGRSGMCKCPFHNDKNPSMKVDQRFHCFGCQADGDVINFTSRLFGLDPKQAAMKLANDFGIQYDPEQKTSYVPRKPAISEKEIFRLRFSYCYNTLISYRNLLSQWLQQYAPKTPDEEIHPRFLEALHNLRYVEYQLDVLLSGDTSEIEQMVNDFLKDEHNQKEVPAVEPIIKTPVYYQSAAYARAHGELDQFRQSHQANMACKKDIEDAIATHFDGMRLNKKAVDEVMEKYGPERVGQVLAATIQVKSWDGRFSSTNKEWAFTYDFPEVHDGLGMDRRDDYAVTSHPAVLDGFINTARKEIMALEHPERDPEAGNPDEKKFAVLLTDEQEVKILECDPQEEMFSIARGTLGCEWIELVEPDSLAKDGYLMLIDEEGKLHDDVKYINCLASDLYESDQHGDPIIGGAMIVRATDENLELLTKKEANDLASTLDLKKDLAIDKISKAFGLRPATKEEIEKLAPARRQPCKSSGMER